MSNFWSVAAPVIGGAAGFAIGGPAGAAVGASLGGAASAYMGDKEQEEAMRGQSSALLDLSERIKRDSAPSFEELASLKNLVTQRDEGLKYLQAQSYRLQQQMGQYDDVVKEQGRQVYAMLKGEDDKYASLASKDIQRSRGQFEQQMQQRLGPGWRTSSAGLEAMFRFEDQAQRYMLNARDAGINNLLKVSGLQSQGLQNIMSAENAKTALAQNVLGAEGAFKQRRLAALQTEEAGINANAQANIMRGQAMTNLGSTIANVGAQAAGFGMQSSAMSQNQQLINAIASMNKQPAVQPVQQEAQLGQVMSPWKSNPYNSPNQFGSVQFGTTTGRDEFGNYIQSRGY